MALDRQSIEKKDFPVGRRGYDPEAVQVHLNAIAEQVEELKRSTRSRGDSLAAASSEHVRAIVEAAEATASQIKGDAEQEAGQLLRETRAEAGEYVSKLSASVAALLERIDTMEQELGTLVGSLRTGAGRLAGELTLIEAGVAELKGSVSPPSASEPAAAEEEELEEEELEEEEEELAEEEELEGELEEEGLAAPPAAANSSSAAGDEDLEGARLIALNMALSNTPRDQIDSYLADNFELSDRAALLDEVYESLGA